MADPRRPRRDARDSASATGPNGRSRSHRVESGAYRPVLVLSGGAALGAFQVGLLQAVYRAGFTPKAIVGTSVGALNGAFLAFRPGPEGADRLAMAWQELRTRDVFDWNPLYVARNLLTRRHCLLGNDGIRHLVERYIPDDDIAAAAVPLHVVTTNLTRGEKAVLSSGPVHRAVLASVAIPGVLCPVTIGGELYVDGGVVANLDIATAVAAGATHVLAVDALGCPDPPGATDVLGIVTRAMALQARSQVADVVARWSSHAHITLLCPPRSARTSLFSLTRTADLLAEGLAHGLAIVPSLFAKGKLLATPTDLAGSPRSEVSASETRAKPGDRPSAQA